jgi:hypothetical protein
LHRKPVTGSQVALTGIICLVAILLSFMESVILLLLLNLRPWDVLLVSVLIDLGVPDVRRSTHDDLSR